MSEAEASPVGVTWRLVRQQSMYLGATVLVVGLAALILGAVAAALQAQRDETRNADVLIVVAQAVPPTPLADHVFELYRRGYGPQVRLVGEGYEGLRAQLIERGVPEEALGTSAPEGGTAAQLETVAAEILASGGESVLVVAEVEELLAGLKLISDQGLRAYGAPVPGSIPGVLELTWASARYWRYALLQM